MHLTVSFSHFNVKTENILILSDAVDVITGLRGAELLDSLILINLVPGISVVV